MQTETYKQKELALVRATVNWKLTGECPDGIPPAFMELCFLVIAREDV